MEAALEAAAMGTGGKENGAENGEGEGLADPNPSPTLTLTLTLTLPVPLPLTRQVSRLAHDCMAWGARVALCEGPLPLTPYA